MSGVPMSSDAARPDIGTASSRFFRRHRGLGLAALLTGPLGWLTAIYLGSLGTLLVTSLYTTDSFSSEVVKELSTQNFDKVLSESVYRVVTVRTLGIAVAVTLIDLVLALPVAFFMAKVASARGRTVMFASILLPLWASYVVKAYVWRAMLDPESGVIKRTFGGSPGFGVTGVIIVLSYLWLPYMVLPIYAGLEKLPDSMLEASADLGGRAAVTFRRVILPLVFPSIVAGSVFTFSLSLGDYIAAQFVGGKTQVLGNVIYRAFGAPDLPLAAALSVVPVVIILVYLLGIRRTGALENL